MILKTPQHLIDSNLVWAEKVKQENPEFFADLSKGQTPECLWIGCADSRVPPNRITDVMPGEIFVHRNIANVVVHTDLNCLSVIQYAVEVLKVKHIIVCGHYSCGGVEAAVKDQDHGLINNWLRHIKDVIRNHAQELKQLTDHALVNRVCELNAIEQAINVCNTSIVQQAWSQGQSLSVNAWIYDLEDGIIKDLGVSISSKKELKEKT